MLNLLNTFSVTNRTGRLLEQKRSDVVSNESLQVLVHIETDTPRHTIDVPLNEIKVKQRNRCFGCLLTLRRSL